MKKAMIANEIRGRPDAGEVRAEGMERFMSQKHCENIHKALTEKIQSMDTRREAIAQEMVLGREGLVKELVNGREGLYMEMEGTRKEMVELERRLNKADEDRTSGLHIRLNEILSA